LTTSSLLSSSLNRINLFTVVELLHIVIDLGFMDSMVFLPSFPRVMRMLQPRSVKGGTEHRSEQETNHPSKGLKYLVRSSVGFAEEIFGEQDIVLATVPHFLFWRTWKGLVFFGVM
jgi:hypothetical protein